MITYREAIRGALADALARDPRVFLMGEDIGAYGGCYAVTQGLLERFGPQRVRDTPLSELAVTGAGIGAALGGLRPIVELMTVNFSLLALDQVVNGAATLRHMSGGQLGVPLVIRMATGGGRQVAAQHSHSLEGWYAHVPGLVVAAPATVADAAAMLPAALEAEDPVVLFEHVGLYATEGEPAPAPSAPVLRGAAVRRAGGDVSLITFGGMLPRVLAAADALSAVGVEAEVIDLRVLRPLDEATLVASVRRTGSAVVVTEEWRSGSLAAEVASRVTEGAFDVLRAPVGRLGAIEVPMPYPRHLEEAALPQVEAIVRAARAVAAAPRTRVSAAPTATPVPTAP